MKFKYRENRPDQSFSNDFYDEVSYFSKIEEASGNQNKKERGVTLELPKLEFERRIEIEKESKIFHISWIVLSIIAMIWGLLTSRFGFWVSSLLSIGFAILMGFFTHPGSWKDDEHKLSFWNASVTVGVLLKSVTPKIYKHRNLIRWFVFICLVLTLLFKRDVAAVFFGLFLLTGLLSLSERDFSTFSSQARILAWYSIFPALIQILIHGGIPLVYTIIAITLFNVYERFDGIVIEYPYWLEEEQF